MDKVIEFNALPIGTIFTWGDIQCVKIRDADVGVPISRQKPNSIRLSNMHYGVLGHKAKCSIIKNPEDY